MVAPGLRAADHLDSTAAFTPELSADITDVYTWMNGDGDKLNLVMDVFHDAPDDAVLSPTVQYVFHVNSSAQFGAPQTETLIMCTFAPNGRGQCWAGADEYIGDIEPGVEKTSQSGAVKVWFGLRNDPFFFNLDGFNMAATTITAAAPGLTFDAAGCPAVNMATATALQMQLSTGGDFFEGNNIMAIVVQVDETVVNAGGPILGVWASTHTAP